ncbi:MAG TPA: acetyltransferase [Chloroflexaceae bacterium]|nr:acetyltransferase [Chloroflexaceae bacterium]
MRGKPRSHPVPLLLLGGGGHARVLIEAVQALGTYTIVGLLDPRPELHNTRILGVPVLGGDERLQNVYAQGVRHALVALGSVGNAATRRRVYEHGRAAGFELVTLTHPRASVSPTATLGAGATVLNGAVVGTYVSLGENVIVNTGAVVEHDSVVGDHVHVATRACLAGGVSVGALAHIGANAVVREGVRIGEGAVVGAGAAVVGDVPAWTTVVGVPARPMATRVAQSPPR